jgi:hypothetical protein
MAVSTTEAPTKVTHPREKSALNVAASANPLFDFSAADDIGPELAIHTARPEAAGTTQTVQGIDLSGKKKIIFWVGRGKTGKTTGIRWSAEAALADGRSLLMADMDPTNDTFSRYLENVARPPEASDPAASLKWLDRLLQHALQNGISLLVDLGGGDTTLRRLVTQLPDLVALFEAEGFAVVVFYTVGPQEEDLSPLATLEGLSFKPTATAIVLNEALVEVGDARDAAFTRIYRHSAFRAAVERGAVPVWMPKLIPAQQVEVRRLHFRDAVAGQAGRGTAPLGPFDRTRVATWLRAMDANFAGIETWLP